ncbi:BNR repeat domain protein [Desulfovibrio sp. DV]|uniref:RCC1 domain-containing protein n=1 Tax=Desulfovibrio sp. DV TaxID=1844708 RepID=UPI00094B9013|nr:RCC1 repeat-containing protein [Desulfovibrio sp. DV]OLN24399.1 BNR repeat domain protein [Desulfovibrio sp. DV]
MHPARRGTGLCVGVVVAAMFFFCSCPLQAGVTPRLASGANYALCLYADGTIRAWGSNGAGQLGDGGSSGGATPVTVKGLTGVVTLAAGIQHALAIRNDGTLWAWGGNSEGELGNNSTSSANVPVQTVQPEGLSHPIAVAGGCYHSLALANDGSVWAWGSNAMGQLGNNTTTNSLTPIKIQGLGSIRAIAAGCTHSLALANDGTVWAWGDNSAGQLGDGSNTNRLTPVTMDQSTGLTSAKAIAGGWKHSVLLHSNGTVWGSGLNDVGELGIGVPGNRNQPAMASNLAHVSGIGAGDYHSLAVTEAGMVYTWGWGHYGQLGSGETLNRLNPGLVAGLSGIVQVVGGNGHSLSLKSHGHVWAWGENSDGQIGDGTYTQRLLPVEGLNDPWAPAALVAATWLLLP